MDGSLEARWTDLGVANATQVLNLAETITERTLLQPPQTEPRGAASAPSEPHLPHISLVLPGASGPAPAAPGAAQPDLEVLRVLGQGGMGRVLLAHQASLHRDVAVKVVNPDVDEATVLQSLLTEAVTTGSLEHPSIVPVHALGCDDAGRPVMVMKRIEGVSWRELARAPDHPAWAAIETGRENHLDAHLNILMQVCNALHFAHARGVVHRDVKPANVMIGSFGEVYVVDWGIAVQMGPKAAERGLALLGTPTYMAPEMVWGDARRVDARTDVFLLGATLHSVLTGKPRHPGDNLLDMLMAARDALPYDYGFEVPSELASICNRATSRDPAQRYPSALAFRRAVAEYLRHKSSISLSDGATAQLLEFRAAKDGSVDSRTLHRLMTECRFGFTQALREWKDNGPARTGLTACLVVMIEHELAQQDRDGAAALIAELPEPRPDLQRRLEELDKELRSRPERDERLRQMERDADLTVDSRPRFVLFALIAVSAIGLSANALRFGAEEIGPRELLLFILVIDGIIGLAIAVGHRRLLSTGPGRLGVGAVVVWAVATLGHRLLAVRLDTPVDAILSVDLLLTATVLAIGALALPRWIWWAVSAAALGTVAAAARPDLAVSIYSGASMAVCVVLFWGGYRMMK